MSSSRRPLPALVHTAFYKFTPLPQPEEVAARLRQLVSQQVDGLTGSILVATEGINGMLAGTLEAVDHIENALLQDRPLQAPSTAWRSSAVHAPRPRSAK